MRLLIVDDEHHIVDYLAALIKEEIPLDLEVYKCYSGKDALALLSSVHMDIVMLDIHMPELTGLDVATIVSAQYPNCRIMFLTAFSDFNHIYESSKLNHTRYLLKTEPDEMILKAISLTIEEIKEEADTLFLLSEAEQKALLLSHLLQQNILKGILMGQKISQMTTELNLLGSDFTLDLQRPVYLMYSQIHYKTLMESNVNDSTHILRYLQFVKTLLLEKFTFSMADMGQGTMLWFFQPTAALPSEIDFLKVFTNEFSDYCTTQLHQHTTTVLFPDSASFEHVFDYFHMMQTYAETSISAASLIYPSIHTSAGEDAITDASDAVLESPQMNTEKLSQELSFYLNQNQEAEYLDVLRKLQAECIKIRSMHDIRAVIIHHSVSLMLLKYIKLYHLQEKICSKMALYPLYYTQDFFSWETVFDYLESLSICIFEILSSKKLDKSELLVNKIKLYIKEHLADSLTLTIVSRLINYNETYVSKLFKQVTGLGLSEYVSLERIKKAKYLLASGNESIQNIAISTGFDTAQYFSLVFKKVTGISPSDYRRSHL